MVRKDFKARVKIDEETNILITPYNHDETRKRYQEIKPTLHGGISESGSTYLLKISVSKQLKPRKAAEIMLNEATTATEYLYDLNSDEDE